MDATGISTEDKVIEKEGKILQSFILIIEPYSGYIYPEPIIITNKSKKVRYYNNAFTSYDNAKLLRTFIEIYGKPKQIRLDNDKTIKNKYMLTVIEDNLKIKTIFAKHPWQKSIERTIRDIKDKCLSIIVEAKTIEEAKTAIKQAIEKYNTSYHKFSHFNQKHIPEEVFAVSLQEFTPIDKESLYKAFMEEKLATVQNNKIQWEGYVYEFLLHQGLREGDYGRKPKAPQVIVRRHIDNASYLEVFDAETGEYLGIAKLISSDVPTMDLAKARQLKNAQKRAKAKEKKLTEEINQINQEVEKMQNQILEENLVKPEEILNTPILPADEKEEGDTLPSVFEILKGGMNNA